MAVVVTGANGFIGYHTVKQLLEKGYKVTALDVSTNRLASNFGLNQNLRYCQLDINSDSLKNHIEPGDKILHLAAIAHYVTKEHVTRTIRVNVEGTVNVVLSAMAKKAERIVFSSTGSVYSQDVEVPIREDAKLGPSNDNYYGWSKKQAEEWIRLFKDQLPHVILRYPYIYGALKDWGAIGVWMYHNIPENKPLVIYGGKQANDFAYIKDVVNANLLALESDRINQVYNIGTGRATSVLDACDYCLKAVGSDCKPSVEPARVFDYPVFVYDITKARELLNYRPEWNLFDGIKDMAENMDELTQTCRH